MKQFLPILFIFLLASCGSSREFQRNPVDDLIRDMHQEPNFSIILFDMDVEGNFSKTYKHQYAIIKLDKDSIPHEVKTDWKNVSEDFFFQHENNMGMSIASKTQDGKVSKIASPPGYENYVGNERYGEWRSNGSGGSFWAFYGQYAFLSSMLGMNNRPIYRSDYRDYNRNYRGRTAYYGSKDRNGNPRYGTNSTHNRTSRPDFFQRRANKSGFKRSNSRNSRTSRNGSRYRSRSSSRSRGGGFGK